MPLIGEVYTSKIYYKGTSGPFKIRPVVLINYDAPLCTIAELTSVPPKNPPNYFDTCKQEIKMWKKAGLNNPSYVKCHKNNLHRVSKNRLQKKLGELETNDLTSILGKIVDVNT